MMFGTIPPWLSFDFVVGTLVVFLVSIGVLAFCLVRTRRAIRRANFWLVEDQRDIKRLNTEMVALRAAYQHVTRTLSGTPSTAVRPVPHPRPVRPPVPSTNPIARVGRHSRVPKEGAKNG